MPTRQTYQRSHLRVVASPDAAPKQRSANEAGEPSSDPMAEGTADRSCVHVPIPVRSSPPLSVVTCTICGDVEWLGQDGGIDPVRAIALAFGDFDLTATLDGPVLGHGVSRHDGGRHVGVYVPVDADGRRALAAFPPGVWFAVAPGLQMSTDGRRLLLAARERLSRPA